MAAYFDLEIWQFDVVKAFLNASRAKEQPITVTLPEGFAESGKVALLEQALYGLKDSLLLWYQEFTKTLNLNGMEASPEELCLFYTADRKVFLVVYVDDFKVAYRAEDKEKAQNIINRIGGSLEAAQASMADVLTQNGNSQHTEDNDVTMTGTNGSEKKDVKLEDLFADGDSDEEFPSSRPNGVKPSSPPVAPSSPLENGNGISSSDPELLRMFYQRLFPFRYLFQWLNHSQKPTNDFAHREFALTIHNATGNEIYLRYQSYPTADTIRKDIISKLPSRFEIGPVYTTNPTRPQVITFPEQLQAPREGAMLRYRLDGLR
ncbi:hypothetical protein NUW58_g124 [Xylaria curta]|uniref:Uncharacterized protein n=1 Tax=Xylaria curta TaxID=42375 RepID=A0ACC1PSG0_9PEZI|nr:hypothetical protein NUW58_g124 [Xylaria curta]